MKLMLARDLVDGTARKAMSPQRRKRILEANGNVCAYEGCDVTERLELDHIIPLALGGADDDSQMVPLCQAHHREKTRRDVWMIAKAKRQRRLVEEVKPSARPIPGRKLEGRGFQQHPTLVRGVNGRVRSR